jgi:hypothetical protein
MTSISDNVMSWLLGRPPTSFTEYARRTLTVR